MPVGGYCEGVRTVYLGTSGFAATVLRRLDAAGHRPLLVVSRPNRPRGRGRKVAATPVAAEAAALGIELFQPEDVNASDSTLRIAAYKPDVLTMCAFGRLIGEGLLFSYEILNVHPSLLPGWRGAAPIERAIEAGDTETGVSIMRVVEALDAGDVCLRESTEIRDDETFGELSGRLAVMGGDLLAQALDDLRRDELRWKPQDESLVTYAEKIDAADRRLDLRRSAAEVARTVRALTPHIGAYVETVEGDRLTLVRVRPRPTGGGDPGKVAASRSSLAISCGEGSLDVLDLKPAGKSEMSIASYLAGRQPPRRFGSVYK